MPDLLMPRPLLVVHQWLVSRPSITAVIDTRVSNKLDGTFPAIRLTDLGPITRGPEEGLQRIQVECWAATDKESEGLAALVVAELPHAAATWPAGVCAGGTVTSGPFASPDQTSQRHRHQLDVALWMFPTPA